MTMYVAGVTKTIQGLVIAKLYNVKTNNLIVHGPVIDYIF